MYKDKDRRAADSYAIVEPRQKKDLVDSDVSQNGPNQNEAKEGTKYG